MNVQGDFDSRWTFEVLESKKEVSETSKTERPLMRFWERDAPEEVGKVLWFEKTRLSCACGCEPVKPPYLYLVSCSELVDLIPSQIEMVAPVTFSIT
jgi:hypothetical protein